MVRLSVVYLMLVALFACDVPPQVALERAQLAQAADPEETEKDCGCNGGENCPNAESAATDPAPPAIYQRVKIDDRPAAVYRQGALRDADARDAEEALVTVAVFSDYQCPFCARGDATLKALAAEHGNRLRVVMKQLPLPMHPNARKAALAALAAGDQGRYWEMHERLFQDPKQLDDAALEAHAQALGLDLERFRASMSDPAHQRRIQEDVAEAKALGIRGTPAFFINGRRVDGARSPAVFKSVISEALQRAEALLSQGVPRAQLYGRLMESLPASAQQ